MAVVSTGRVSISARPAWGPRAPAARTVSWRADLLTRWTRAAETSRPGPTSHGQATERCRCEGTTSCMPRGDGGGVGSLWRCLSPSWRRWSLWLFRRLGGAMTQAEGTPGLRYGLLLALLVVGCLLLSPLFLLLVGEGGCGSSSLAGPSRSAAAGRPVGGSDGAVVGVAGGLGQRFGRDRGQPRAGKPVCNPTDAGGGLAQWKPGRYGQMVAYTASVGLSPTSDQGQLVFLQYDLRTSYSSLLSRMDTAPDLGAAAEMFETTYELCQGVVGYMDVIAGSLCEDANRKLYAVPRARRGGRRLGLPRGRCRWLCWATVARRRRGSDRAEIRSPHRRGRRGATIWAWTRPLRSARRSTRPPASSTLVEVLPWFPGPCGMQPLLLLRFTQEQPGTEDGDQYWYVAEQITPVHANDRHDVGPQGNRWRTSLRAGPGSRLAGGRRPPLTGCWRGQMGDGAAANPAAGSLTPWAESFKRWCRMPASWLGTSP